MRINYTRTNLLPILGLENPNRISNPFYIDVNPQKFTPVSQEAMMKASGRASKAENAKQLAQQAEALKGKYCEHCGTELPKYNPDGSRITLDNMDEEALFNYFFENVYDPDPWSGPPAYTAFNTWKNQHYTLNPLTPEEFEKSIAEYENMLVDAKNLKFLYSLIPFEIIEEDGKSRVNLLLEDSHFSLDQANAIIDVYI